MRSVFRWPVLWWLRFWARLALARINPMIIGVTGSAGKTSAVEAIRHVVALKFKRIKVAEKANSESGIPADILGLHFTNYSLLDWLRIFLLAPARSISYLISHISYVDCYVAEMGIDEARPPKNMGYLLTIVKPHIGVVLNALPVHSEQFGDQLGLTDQQEIVEAIAQEKGRMITENGKLNTAILNADQPEVAKLANTGTSRKSRTITFGRSKNADLVIESVNATLSGTTISFLFKRPGPGGPGLKGPGPANPQGQALIDRRLHASRFTLYIPQVVLPAFYGHTFASALAVGLTLGIDPKKACEAISTRFTLPAGRGQIFRGINDTTIIDSSYNASRETMIGSLELLRTMNHERRTIGILGDMRELGSLAKQEHEAVARAALETLDEAVLVGPLMKQYALPYGSSGNFHWFRTAGDAARFIPSMMRGGEVILVKGSQNTIFLEIVVEALLADETDVVKLCRRGPFWDKQRQSFR